MNNQRIVVSVNLKRTIKIMKLTVLMLVVCLSQMVAATYAQTTKLSVSVKNETLEHVLKQIEEQSEFLFFYNLEEINKNERISIDKRYEYLRNSGCDCRKNRTEICNKGSSYCIDGE